MSRLGFFGNSLVALAVMASFVTNHLRACSVAVFACSEHGIWVAVGSHDGSFL